MLPSVRLNDFLPLDTLAITEEQAALPVTGICVDTRQLQAGNAFFALHGHQFDGRPYIPQAIALGAALVLVSGETPTAYWHEQTLMIEWPNLLQQASALAARYFSALEPAPCELTSVMAVTGTNGKTTCSHLYAQLWHRLGQRAATIGTLGSGLVGDTVHENPCQLAPTGYTTPDAITLQAEIYRLRQQRAQVLSLEASSHSLHQYRMAAVPVSTAVFTNLTRDHLDYHGSMTAYAESKARLLDYPQVSHRVINADDEQGWDWLCHHPRTQAQATWFAYSVQDLSHRSLPKGVEAVYVSEWDFQVQGIQATLHSPWGTGRLVTRLIGRFNLSNLLAVVTAALAEGADFDAVLAAVPHLVPVKGRMDVMTADTASLPRVVIDYAHTPDALEQALSVIRQHAKGHVWCVFGCGGDRDGGKRAVMGNIAARLADHVIVTNDNPRSECPNAIAEAILAGVSQASPTKDGSAVRSRVELDRAKAIDWALSHAQADDWVLIAGKGHEDYQIVGEQRGFFSDHQAVASVFQRHSKPSS